MNPIWGTILNFVIGIFGVAESTGLTNVLSTQGGKTGVIVATGLALANAALHGISSAQPGILNGILPPSPPNPPGVSGNMRNMG